MATMILVADFGDKKFSMLTDSSRDMKKIVINASVLTTNISVTSIYSFTA